MNFLKKILVDTNGCWLYQGAIKKTGLGYGWVTYEKKQMNAHRASWIIKNGAIDKGLSVCHKCDVPSCINPDHLFLGTHSENIKDMWNKKRHKPTNEGGEKNPASKLTLDQVKQIRILLSEKVKQRVIAEKFNVSVPTISNIKTSYRWQNF
jgi:predicted DNA-binding protein (UPF0251 family)